MKDTKSDSAKISKIENVTLRTEVADVLRNAIINGLFKPGTPIVEMALAEQLDVSRAPVREAIQLLENEGLIETLAYKGKRVKPLARKDVDELYSLREVLELFAARRIIEAGTDVSELRLHCDAMVEAANAQDLVALNAADEAFHRAIIRLSNHDLLLSQWNNVYLRVRQVMALRNSANRDLGAVARNHPPIVDALEGRDLARVTELLSQHVRSAADLDLSSTEWSQ
ncbi:GntR family transcriptional regulator [Mesorhizobium sp. WSM4887]|uniref:GntR family transcriptional regulator n=1 Tax=Mesorhizobium sp. WSM4887 TaxID=3038543 RepID=UPI002415E3C9|nr:GntR family transcriptional regulator [Mesorhizobium sp. WSM4887]MDG4889762.1 GntR family transcriptional regulator [Mesorhizobium sp. WSM4887]